MALNQSLINILKILEIKKIKEISLMIKKLFYEKNKNAQQLKILSDYQADYYIKFAKKLKLGLSSIQWKNYIDFLIMLNTGIKKQKKISLEYKIKVEKKILKLSSIYNKIQLWNALYLKIANNNLKKRIILDQLKLDELSHINLLNNK